MTRPPTDTRRRWRTLAAALGTFALVGVTVACDATKSGTAEVATLDKSSKDDKDSGDGAKKEPTEQERNDAMLEFAACMREHGVDMADPQMDGDGGVAISVGATAASAGGAPTGPDEAEMQKMDDANEACEPIMEDVMGEPEEMSPEDQAKFRDEQLAYAKCMRENGVDMPDPQIDFEGGRTKINMGGTEQGTPIDPNSPTFQAATEACESLLGDGRIAIAGGPGGGATPIGGTSSGSVITSEASDGGDK